MRLLPIAAILSLLCASCTTTSVTPLVTAGTFAPTDPAQVQVFRSKHDVPGPYRELAIIHSQGDSKFANQAGMIAEAREEAATYGANGVIVQSFDEPDETAEIAGAVVGFSTMRKGEILAIRYELRATPAPPKHATDGGQPEVWTGD